MRTPTTRTVLCAFALAGPLIVTDLSADRVARAAIDAFLGEPPAQPSAYEGYVGYRGGSGYTPTGYIGTPTYRTQADRYRYQYNYAKRGYSPPQRYQYVRYNYPTATRAYASSWRGRVVHGGKFRR